MIRGKFFDGFIVGVTATCAFLISILLILDWVLR
jgi:hypothetical protein